MAHICASFEKKESDKSYLQTNLSNLSFTLMHARNASSELKFPNFRKVNESLVLFIVLFFANVTCYKRCDVFVACFSNILAN